MQRQQCEIRELMRSFVSLRRIHFFKNITQDTKMLAISKYKFLFPDEAIGFQKYFRKKIFSSSQIPFHTLHK